MPKTKKPETPARYIAEDGCYLDIVERDSDEYYIAWYIPEDGDFGGYLGELGTKVSDEDPETKAAWEGNTAIKAVQPFSVRQNSQGFVFDSLKKARLALNTANEALITGHAPWPAWAIQARDAGWTPPEGWKP